MKKILGAVVLLVSAIFSQTAMASDTTIAPSIFKVQVYSRDPVTEEFSGPIQTGSAVYIGSGTLITNYHVVADAQKEVSNYVELCMTSNIKKKPDCFTDATVIKADKDADLALLKFQNVPKRLKAVTFAKKVPNLGDKIKVFGYPAIGGGNITFTEGKVSGFDEKNIKTDATIDSGNSGGGAFGPKDQLVGIPSAIISENNTIGYVISLDKVREFLAKTDSNTYTTNASNIANFKKYLSRVEDYYRIKGNFNNGTFNWKGFENMGFRLVSVTGNKKGEETFSFLNSEKKTYVVVMYNDINSEENFIAQQKIKESQKGTSCKTVNSKTLWNVRICSYEDSSDQDFYYMIPSKNQNIMLAYLSTEKSKDSEDSSLKFFEAVDLLAPTKLLHSFELGKIRMDSIPENLLHIKNVSGNSFSIANGSGSSRGFQVLAVAVPDAKRSEITDYASYAKYNFQTMEKSKVLDGEDAEFQYIKLPNGLTCLKISYIYISKKGYSTFYLIPSVESNKLVEYQFSIMHDSFEDAESNEAWMEEMLGKLVKFNGKTFENPPFEYNKVLDMK